MKFISYIRLMRIDKPVGYVLLWAPTACALWLANKGAPALSLFFYFALGTLLMRSAGCIINDLCDRNIDPHVQRTCTRPLAAGSLTIKQALIVLFILLFISLIIVLQLPWLCLVEANVALLITCIYPLCKRFIKSPQLVLSLAFSMGIPMAYTASNAVMDRSMLLLMLLNGLWILYYDTIYALMDEADDLKIGINSTAIFFGKYTPVVLIFLQIIFHSLWVIIYYTYNHEFFSVDCILIWIVAAALLIYQDLLLRQRTTLSYLAGFLNNSWYGLLMWLWAICVTGSMKSIINFVHDLISTVWR